MKKVYCYHLIDKYGVRRDIVTSHDEETVCVEGLRGHRRKAIHFESSAYHLESWCEENDVTLERFQVEIDLEKREARVV